MRGDTRYPNAYATGRYNIADAYERTRALRQRTFLDGLWYLDDQAELIIDRFLPPAPLPDWDFRARIKINSAGMSPMVRPGSATEFHTTDWRYEDFSAQRVKDGFEINEWDLKYMRVGNMVGELSSEMYDRMKLRKEYTGIQGILGNGWNNQPTHRLVQGWTLNWANANSLPIADILKAKLMVKLMSGKTVKYCLVNSTDANNLQNHGNILQQLQYTSKDLLTNGLVALIKGVQIIEVDSFYKEMSDETTMLGAPGRGDFRESVFDEQVPGPDLKTYLLSGYAVFLTDDVGKLHSTPTDGNNWLDKDQNKIKYNAWADICPVIKDYGKICVLRFLDADEFNDNNQETVTGNLYGRWTT
jgi:hypothetical protein